MIAVTLGFYGFFMSCINVCSAPTRQSRMSAENQGAMHAAFRTVTWGVIPLAALVGGLAVTLLTAPLGILDASQGGVMAGGTSSAAFSFLPRLADPAVLDRPSARPSGDRRRAGAGGNATARTTRDRGRS